MLKIICLYYITYFLLYIGKNILLFMNVSIGILVFKTRKNSLKILSHWYN